MHPLLGNLQNLSDDDLQKKLSELNNRYMQAFRSGSSQLIPQLQMLIEDYRAELARRNAVKMQELQEKFDKMNNKDGGKGLKGIIDIK
jgi:hypothetical protein